MNVDKLLPEANSCRHSQGNFNYCGIVRSILVKAWLSCFTCNHGVRLFTIYKSVFL